MKKHDPILLKNDREGHRQLAEKGLLLGSGLSQLGNETIFESPFRLSNAVAIGKVGLGAFSYVGAASEIRNATIGRFCSIAANVAIGPAEHPVDWVSSHPFQFDGVRYFDAFSDWQSYAGKGERFLGNSGRTKIGHDVWIGRNVVVRQGVSVGHGAVIASGAFVNKDVPPYAIVAGVPARVIRYRFSDLLVEKLLEINWWNWRLEPQRFDLRFNNPEVFVEKMTGLLADKLVEKFVPAVWRLSKRVDGYSLSEVGQDAL